MKLPGFFRIFRRGEEKPGKGEIRCPETKEICDFNYCSSFCSGEGCMYLNKCWDLGKLEMDELLKLEEDKEDLEKIEIEMEELKDES